MGILDLFKKKEARHEAPDLIDEQMKGMDAGFESGPAFGPKGAEFPPIGAPSRPDASGAFGQSSPASFGERQQFEQNVSQEQQFQLISAKLDTIKAQLETVMQRLDRMERDEHPYRERWRTGM